MKVEAEILTQLHVYDACELKSGIKYIPDEFGMAFCTPLNVSMLMQL